MKRKKELIIGLCTAIACYALFVIGIAGMLKNPIELRNHLAFWAFSLVAGGLMVLLLSRFRIAAIGLAAGLIIGFADMLRAFSRDMSGWNDLVGLLSLFAWVLIFLSAGIIAQIVYWLFSLRKSKKNKKPDSGESK